MFFVMLALIFFRATDRASQETHRRLFAPKKLADPKHRQHTRRMVKP